MTLVYADRVQETTTTTGTGTYTLAGAAVGYQSFATVGDGNTCYYAITDGTNWEVGLGTYTLSGTTLARTSIKASSNSNAAVSWGAGSKNIWLDLPALVATYLAGGTTGTGAVVLAAAPSLTTPALGVASATSINKVTLTAPASGSTLTVADGKTLTANNSLTLAGTDSTTMTFPGSSSTVLTTGVAATITTGYTVTPNNIGTVSSGTTTPSLASGNYQYYTNNGAHTLAAPANDGAISILVTNGASAGAITFSGFTVGSSTGDALTTTNTSKFLITVVRINGVSTYTIKALQ